MSDLPEGWIEAPFMEVFDIQGGTQPPKSVFKYDPQEGYVRLLQIRDFGTKPLATYIPVKTTLKRCTTNDVLVGRYGASVGRICTGMDGAYNVALAKVVIPEGVDKKFVTYLLKSELFQRPILDIERSAQDGFNKDDLSEISLPIAPEKEQRRIVAKLENLLSRVDAARARLETIPRILKRFRQSVLAAACSGRLTAGWRRTHSKNEPAAARLAKIKQARLALVRNDAQAAKVSRSFSELESQADVAAPRGWLTLRAESICDFITKGTTPNTKEITSDGDVPFLKVQHIIDNKLEFWSLPCFVPNEIHNGVLKRSKVFPKDVLMNIVGPPLNKVAIVPNDFPEWNINQALAIFRPVEGVEPEYLQLILSHEETLEHVLQETRGIVGQSNISLEQCRDLLILLPTQAEQQEIIRRVKALFKTADVLEARYRKAKTHVDRLTQSILAKAFRGELVPQDPNDEPASVLLENIKSERESRAVVRSKSSKANPRARSKHAFQHQQDN